MSVRGDPGAGLGEFIQREDLQLGLGEQLSERRELSDPGLVGDRGRFVRRPPVPPAVLYGTSGFSLTGADLALYDRAPLKVRSRRPIRFGLRSDDLSQPVSDLPLRWSGSPANARRDMGELSP